MKKTNKITTIITTSKIQPPPTKKEVIAAMVQASKAQFAQETIKAKSEGPELLKQARAALKTWITKNKAAALQLMLDTASNSYGGADYVNVSMSVSKKIAPDVTALFEKADEANNRARQTFSEEYEYKRISALLEFDRERISALAKSPDILALLESVNRREVKTIDHGCGE